MFRQLPVKPYRHVELLFAMMTRQLSLPASWQAAETAWVILGRSSQVLMAGPRISPRQTFRTYNGRHIPADKMRAAIHRLNAQHTYLAGHSSSVGFQATSPTSMEALIVRPPSAPAVITGGSKMKLTCIERQDFNMRPRTAGPHAVKQAGHDDQGMGYSGCAELRPTSHFSINLNSSHIIDVRQRGNSSRTSCFTKTGVLDRHNCSSDFARKLTLRQQLSMADRLSNTHRVKPSSMTNSNAFQDKVGARNMQRNLSLWERPGEVFHSALSQTMLASIVLSNQI